MDSLEPKKNAEEEQQQTTSQKPVSVAKNGDHAIVKVPTRIVSSLEATYVLSVLITLVTWMLDTGGILSDAVGHLPCDTATYSAWDTLNMFMHERLSGPYIAVFFWAMHAPECYVLMVIAYFSHKYRIVYGTSDRQRTLQSVATKFNIILLFLTALWLHSMSDCPWKTLLYEFDLLCIVSFMAHAVYATWDSDVVYTLLAPQSVRESRAAQSSSGGTKPAPKTTEGQKHPTPTTIVQFNEGVLVTAVFVLWIQMQFMPVIFDTLAASYHMARPFAHYSALTVLLSPRTMLLLALVTMSFYPWNWSRITINGVSVRVLMAAYMIGMILLIVVVVHPDSVGAADTHRVEQLHANMQLHDDPWGSQFAACGWFVYDHWKPVQLVMLDGERLPKDFLRAVGSGDPPALLRLGFPHNIMLNRFTLMRYTDYTSVLLRYFQERLAPKYNGTGESPFIIVRTACYFPRLGHSPYGLLSVLGDNNTLHYSVDSGKYDGIEYRGATRKEPAMARQTR